MSKVMSTKPSARGRLSVTVLVVLALLAAAVGSLTGVAPVDAAVEPELAPSALPVAAGPESPAPTASADAGDAGGVASGPVDLPEASISTGEDHSCAVTVVGGVDCWGDNIAAQAADQAGPGFVSVAAGGFHTCALTAAGAIDCWGTGAQAQDQPGPNYVAVTAGLAHSCALTAAGAVDCWGNNGFNQSDDQPGPYTAVSAGDFHTCALTAAGAVDCWGDNSSGQATDQSATTYTSIATGLSHSCAVTAAGGIDCWGANDVEQAPPDVAGTNYVSVAAGTRHTCAVMTTGQVDCWGDNFSGQGTDQLAPLHAQVDGGRDHSCAVTVTGAVSCWGSDAAGQAEDRPAPSLVAAGDRHSCVWTGGGGAECWGGNASGQSVDQAVTGLGSLTTGHTHSCALTAAGGADCWGANDQGQSVDQAGPYGQVDVGVAHTCALKADESVDCWGLNNLGQAADNAAALYTDVSAGWLHTCAVTNGGAVNCWGDNSAGQAVSQPGPNYVSVSAGFLHTCAVTNTGAVDCWGANLNGQADDRGSAPYVKVATSQLNTCALTLAGAIDCWGLSYGGHGQVVHFPAAPYRDLAVGTAHTCALTDAGQVNCWGPDTDGNTGGVPAVTSELPSDAAPGDPYEHQFEATPADVTVSWAVVDGALPPGWSLDETTGLLSGDAPDDGSFSFEVVATSVFGTSEPQEVTLEVTNAVEFGYLRATTSPAVPAAISVDGEVRDSWGLTWLPVPVGQHEVCFGAVSGFSPPSCQVVEVTAGATTEVVGDYAQRGLLRVTTSPALPSTIIVDDVHRNDWGLWTEVDPGSYSLCFAVVNGYNPPPCQVVEVTAGETTTVTGNFTPDPTAQVHPDLGFLRAYTDPAVGSRISIDGNWADSWGLTWVKLWPGTYEVCFEAVLYADAPQCQDVVITTGNTTVAEGDFTVHGFVKVTTSPALPAVVSIGGVDRNVWGVWTSIAPGLHDVCFKPVEGFTAPGCQQVAVTASQTTEVSGVYTPL